MDSERDRNQTPNWVGGKPRPVPVSRRFTVPRYEGPAEPTTWLVNLALVVGLCVVVMAIASVALREWRPSPVATAAAIVVVGKNAQREAERAQSFALDEYERQARVNAAQAAEQRREAATKARLADEEAARRAAAREARRASEWQAYYKKPEYCDESLPNVDSIGCANDFIRQRRAFDERFNAGRS
ncbi:MAG TPA: hypothetical protein VF319_12335 [Caldimonas sp.]